MLCVDPDAAQLILIDLSTRFRALDASDYRLTWLDELAVIYDRRSGLTHIVASPVPQILEIMQGGDWSVSALLVALAEQFDLPPGEDHSAALAARLDELATLGLVEKSLTEKTAMTASASR